MKLPVTTAETDIYCNQETNLSSCTPGSSDTGRRNETPTGGDFSEYMWMENEEEFEKQVMQQLEEEALMEQCIEAMLEDEREIRNRSYLHNRSESSPIIVPPTWNNLFRNPPDLCKDLENLNVKDHSELAKQSTLNPNAAEFVPQQTLETHVPLSEKAT